MKRDLDLVRELLLALEAAETSLTVPALAGYSGELVSYHFLLLRDAGLVTLDERGPPHRRKSGYRLTWEGHELLDAAREPHRWQKAKSLIEAAGGVTFDVLKTLLTDLAKQTLGLS
jgi:DNA-binding transcriptional ArsR family regulator